MVGPPLGNSVMPLPLINGMCQGHPVKLDLLDLHRLDDANRRPRRVDDRLSPTHEGQRVVLDSVLNQQRSCGGLIARKDRGDELVA